MSKILNEELWTTMTLSVPLAALLGFDASPQVNAPAVYQGHVNPSTLGATPFVSFWPVQANPVEPFAEQHVETHLYEFQLGTRARDESDLEQILRQLDALFHHKTLSLPPRADGSRVATLWGERTAPSTPSMWDTQLEALIGLYRYVWTTVESLR